MHLSAILTTLVSFAVIVAAFPAPDLSLGGRRTYLVERGGPGSRYLNDRAPDVSHISAPNDPDDPQGPMSNDR
ncbi:hypothetical protein CY34DRAFT_811632 [Suillus luteus UH-Slu-Lm8-n1]|uniref:Uncharacterized protein n=1 Tax=Suillus luteus UH-Slu-Lm8-n1 TaxID=930992 RepID=A0A0D0A2Y4_9AGAM|nr:hypothetical protein CY34DRAFT_811632 [Suillus luteus UH-Slu-Lm8-n1]